MFDMLTGTEAGPKEGEDAALVRRQPFAKWLRLGSYDAEAGSFHCSDNTTGYVWECAPVAFMGANCLNGLVNLLKQEFPSDALLQFIQMPSERIAPLLEEYLSRKTRKDSVAQEAAQRYAEHLWAGRSGLQKMRGIPVRQFRLLICVKSKEQMRLEVVRTIEEALRSAGLAPRRLGPGPMLAWFRELFNGTLPENPQAWCENTLLRNQIIGSEYPVEHVSAQQGVMRIGGRYATCLTPKTMPSPAHPLKMNRLLGGYSGVEDDGTQLTYRYIFTANVWFRASKSDIKSQGNLTMMQRAGGSLAKSLKQRVDEIDWVLDDLEQTPYVNISLSMWVFGDDLNQLNEGVARVRGLWERQEFVMQRETTPGIVQAMLINALPFGLIMNDAALKLMDRDFKVSARAAACFLPVQGDFAGYMDPVLLLVGRKGQLTSIDVFDKRANNYNFLVSAGSGAGKSFVTNFVVGNYFGAGALIRCVDIGYSYKKQCHSLKGRFIDVGDSNSRVVINPFQKPRGGDAEDDVMNRQTTANILLMMAYSTVGVTGLTQTHYALMNDAVEFAISCDGGVNGIDHAYEYLRQYPKLAKTEFALEAAQPLAQEIGFNLRDFRSDGVYGRLFNGTATFDISSDHFVVLELEKLLNNKALFSVVSLQVMNAITQDLYLSDRSTQRFQLFDEAWRYLGLGSSALIASVIYEMYRRARKYHGSTGIVTQSLLDLQKFGDVGEVIKANSAFKFLLESEDYQLAVDRGIVDYQGLALELAKSVRNQKPNYSEVLFDTPFGVGVGRLCVDPWTYWMNTSSGDEFKRYEGLVASGRTPLQAITELAGG